MIFIYEFNHYKGCSNELNRTIFVYGTLKDNFHWNSKYLGKESGAIRIGKAETIQTLRLYVGDSGVPYLILNNDDDDDDEDEVQGSLENKKNKEKHNVNDKKNNKNLHDDHDDHDDMQNVIKGELWLVSDETLASLDDYEGINKSYYIRKTINVKILDGENNHKINKNNLYLSKSMIESWDEIRPQNIISAEIYGLSSLKQLLLKHQNLKQISEYTLQLHQQCYKPIRHIQVKQQKHLGDEVGTASNT
jgi:gamma-glutamylcyclotransferase (GGCT)/AIG2-like uncharacterized protein YtfP